ncbi:MAG TPA: nuclear transport factor 2 family protein [Vicinamibacteria bacterium]
METAAELERAVDTLRRAYAAFNAGDMRAAVASLDPEVEWTEPAEFPGGGTYRGPAAVEGYLTRSRASWREGRSEPEQFICAGDSVVVFVRARFLPAEASEWEEVRLADVFTFRGSKVVRMQAYADRDAALRAVGLGR